MVLSDVFRKLGEDAFGQLVRGISIGKLKTYQVYEGFKVRGHFHKLNTETLRHAVPRFWTRLGEGDEEFARDLAQVVLVSHLDLITSVLDFLGVPHENGFFAKDLDAGKYLTEGWQERIYEHFRNTWPEPVLLFYINHLGWELKQADQPFVPASAQ